MKLAQALRLISPLSLHSASPTSIGFGKGQEMIAFVGAGGKSTALFQLARELSSPVIVSATTHLGIWQIPLADTHLILKRPEDLISLLRNGVTLVTGDFEGDRTKGLGYDEISWLHEFCNDIFLPLLIEADGSKQKPLKAPGEHEPPIPEFVESVVQVVGLTGLGKPLEKEFVHRPEIFARLSGMHPGETVTAEALRRVLIHPEGGLKNIPSNARRAIILNQADTPDMQAQARRLVEGLLPTYHSVIIASLKEGIIQAVHEPVGGIVLAAGEAQRFGQPKQLLEWRGEPFVRVVAKTALEAGLSPVIVVTGASHAQVESAIKDLPVLIAYNQAWHSGQASSIKAGLGSLGKWERMGGGIFLLADQPQLTPTILHALVEKHSATLAPILAPMVFDQRANPVLFDQITFPDLMSLEGDVGGRAIFSKYKVDYLPWHDDAMLLDVDTPEHYQRLKELLE